MRLYLTSRVSEKTALNSIVQSIPSQKFSLIAKQPIFCANVRKLWNEYQNGEWDWGEPETRSSIYFRLFVPKCEKRLCKDLICFDFSRNVLVLNSIVPIVCIFLFYIITSSENWALGSENWDSKRNTIYTYIIVYYFLLSSAMKIPKLWTLEYRALSNTLTTLLSVNVSMRHNN